MKIKIKDYPFTVLAQNKVAQSTGKSFVSVSVGQTVIKNRNAADPKEKYATSWLNMFPEDLLKLAEICREAYQQIRADEVKEKDMNTPDFDAEVPF